MLNIPGLPAFYRINEISITILFLIILSLERLKTNILKILNYENGFFSIQGPTFLIS